MGAHTKEDNVSNLSISKTLVEKMAGGTMSHNDIVKALKGVLNPTRTFVEINGDRQEIPTARGIVWFSYAKLKSLGLTRTYGALANGRFLPVTEAGAIVPGFSWVGSSDVVLVHEAA